MASLDSPFSFIILSSKRSDVLRVVELWAPNRANSRSLLENIAGCQRPFNDTTKRQSNPSPAQVLIINMASFDVKSFRHRLLAVHCTLAQQVNDSELESWLFRPGPNRLRLLQWCMCKVDPDLQLSFQNCNENDLEKGMLFESISVNFSQWVVAA